MLSEVRVHQEISLSRAVEVGRETELVFPLLDGKDAAAGVILSVVGIIG